jgi:Lipocalin-like domain
LHEQALRVELFAIALTAECALADDSLAQGSSLRDQLLGTWICASSTGKRDDGSSVPRPNLQGAATYNADGRFHFITTPVNAPKYASNDTARPSPEEAMAAASGAIAYTGTYTVHETSRTILLDIETSTPHSCWSAEPTPHRHLDFR